MLFSTEIDNNIVKKIASCRHYNFDIDLNRFIDDLEKDQTYFLQIFVPIYEYSNLDEWVSADRKENVYSILIRNTDNFKLDTNKIRYSIIDKIDNHLAIKYDPFLEIPFYIDYESPLYIGCTKIKLSTIKSPFIEGNKRYYSTSQDSAGILRDSFNNNLSVNTLEFYKKLNGNTPIKEFDPNNFGSNGFYKIKNILISSTLDLHAKQDLLEISFKQLWENELKEYFKNAKSLDNKGIRLLIEVLSILEKDFDSLFNNKRLMAKKDYLKPVVILDYSNIISICLSKVLPFIVFKNDNFDQKVTSLFESIGVLIYKEVIKTEYEKYVETLPNKECKILYKDYFLENYNYSNEDAIRLGAFITMFIGDKSDLYFIDEINTEIDHTKRVIMPGKLFENLLQDFILFDSYESPMIVKPVEWKIKKNIFSLEGDIANKVVKYGGYLYNDKENFEDLIRKSKESIGSSIIINNKIVEMINYMSGIPFKLNNKVLSYLIDLILNPKNDEFNEQIIKDLSLSFHPKTSSLNDYKEELNKCINIQKNSKSTSYEQINSLKNLIHEIISHNSVFLYNKSILTMAILFKDIKQIYFPLKLDWRGRIYIKGGVLNIQGGELSRSLLMFSKSVKLNDTGLESLKIYCANAFGQDKISKIDRLKWVDENLDKIINIDSMFWTKADDKLIALACCFELKGYYEDPNFESSLPILIDATCNGLQHLSAMMHDVNLAEKVNLLESSKEMKPEDFYSFMIDPIKSKINELASKEIEYSKLALLNIDRSFIKVPIMTISYNITPFGICEQLIKDKFIKIDLVDKEPTNLKIVKKSNKSTTKNPITKMYLYQAIDIKKYGDVILTHKDIFNLSNIIYTSLYETYPKLNELKEYFNSMTDTLSSLGLPIVWVTPSGLTIKQKYVEFTSYDIINNVLSKRKTITLRKPNKEINNRKQVQGFIPNYVHSMDASNIFLLYDGLNILKPKMDIITIHDCFGTHANDVLDLSILVKNAFVSIYKDDKFLKKFHKINVDCIKALVPVKRNKFITKGKIYTIPTPPKIKDMNLEYHLPKSLYFLN